MGCIESAIFPPAQKSNSSRVPILSLPRSYEIKRDTKSEVANLITDHLKDYDKNASIQILEQSNLDSSLHGDIRDTAAVLIQKQARRKAAKLKAEAEKRWLVFSNLDTVAEADMVQVANFMQTVCLKVPQLSQIMNREKSHHELNKSNHDELSSHNTIDKDDNNALHSKNHQTNSSNNNISIVRENSQTFMEALRQIRETQDTKSQMGSRTSSKLSRSGPSSSSKLSRSGLTSSSTKDRTSSDSKERKPYWSQKDTNDVNNTESSDQVSSARQSGRHDSLGSASSSVRSSMREGSVTTVASDVFAFDQIVISSTSDDPKETVYTLEALIPDDQLSSYNLPTGAITPHTVHLLMALYRKGGRLSIESLHKILRVSYKKLKKCENISHVKIDPHDKVTVVGDIHGQFSDLMYILDESGLPSLHGHSKYVFNGDFVDRGPEGVEVIALLLALYCAFPGSVYLNRGNHEEFAVCCAYGFQLECRNKYDNVTFGMFVEVFSHLPLFTILDGWILILHGGLFHSSDATLEDLMAITRQTFMLSDIHVDAVSTNPVPRMLRQDFLRQLQRDALWSDPNPQRGLHLNPRGAGVGFGPDVTKSFLERNGLKMIVRSHECVRTGFDKPYQEPEYADLLCTVFSASNYYGSGNTAAYMIFRKDIPKDIPYTRVSGTDIVYTVHYFITETGADDDDDSKTSVGSISNTLGQTLYDLVLSHKAILLNEFKVLDKEGTGKVSKLQWAEVLQNVSKLQLQWLTLFPVLVSEDLVGKDNVTGNLYVEYEKFLENFSATFDFESVSNHNLLENKINHATGSNTSDQSNSPVALLVNNGNDASSYSGYALEYVQDSPDEHSDLDHSSVTDPRIGGAVVEALYSQHRLLESVFRFFDTNGSGTISLDEFKQGCEIINSTLPEESKLKNVDRLLAIMDVSQKGEVDINEFFEMFRLSDAHMNISAMLSTPKAPPASPGSSSANLNRSHSSARKAITVISPSSTNLT